MARTNATHQREWLARRWRENLARNWPAGPREKADLKQGGAKGEGLVPRQALDFGELSRHGGTVSETAHGVVVGSSARSSGLARLALVWPRGRAPRRSEGADGRARLRLDLLDRLGVIDHQPLPSLEIVI